MGHQGNVIEPQAHRIGAQLRRGFFNLDQTGAGDRDVALPARDVALTRLIFQTRDLNPAAGEAPLPKVQAAIDHVAYRIADFDRERAEAELKSLGVDSGLYSLHMTDPFGYVQISGLANNACGQFWSPAGAVRGAYQQRPTWLAAAALNCSEFGARSEIPEFDDALRALHQLRHAAVCGGPVPTEPQTLRSNLRPLGGAMTRLRCGSTEA